MKFDTVKFNQVVSEAKAKAATDPKWLRAIAKAAAGILDGSLIVTVLAHGALVTGPNGSHHANGACDCQAARHGHTQCYHRAAARLMHRYETAPAAVSRPILPLKDDETRNTCAVCGNTWTANYTSDYCPIHATADPARWRPTASPRATLIAEIENIWPRFAPGVPLYTELLARFGKSNLNMLDDDMLRRVRLAIAM